MKTILEGNTLIAEFDGKDFVPYKGNRSVDVKFKKYSECLDFIKNNQLDGYIPELWWNAKSGGYDHDFKQLMRVVEKITQYKYEDGDTAYFRTFGMLNAEGETMVRINKHQLFQSKTLIEATWLAVVDFIEWHNTQAGGV